jgi:hypothetical protein
MHTLRIWLALIVAAFLVFGSAIAKDVHVKGYTRKDGTYVAPHTRSSPNNTKNDNYSTKGNVNPYTGKAGTKPRDESSQISEAQPAQKTVAQDAPIVGWLAMKSGLPEPELKRQLGMPREVEGVNGMEIWKYPTGTVYVKDQKVVAWKQVKSP